MRPIAGVALLLMLAATGAGTARAAAAPRVALDDTSITRGKAVFAQVCRACHGLRYLGEAALMGADAARAAFGTAAPDLSLMAYARGRGSDGAASIAALLAGYAGTPPRNTVEPTLAMPPPFAADDPELRAKAADVAAFLLDAADPHGRERRRLGPAVVAYLLLLTALLFFVNRRTWRAGGRLPGGARGERGGRP